MLTWFFMMVVLQVDLIDAYTKVGLLGQKINYEAYSYKEEFKLRL